MAIVVLLNAVLGQSSAQYYKKLANNIREMEGTAEEEQSSVQL